MFDTGFAIFGKYRIGTRLNHENVECGWINTEDGEGGEFDIEDIESLLDEFYKKNF